MAIDFAATMEAMRRLASGSGPEAQSAERWINSRSIGTGSQVAKYVPKSAASVPAVTARGILRTLVSLPMLLTYEETHRGLKGVDTLKNRGLDEPVTSAFLRLAKSSDRTKTAHELFPLADRSSLSGWIKSDPTMPQGGSFAEQVAALTKLYGVSGATSGVNSGGGNWGRNELTAIEKLLSVQVPTFDEKDISPDAISNILSFAVSQEANKQAMLADATMESLALGVPVNPEIRNAAASARTFKEKVLSNAKLFHGGKPKERRLAAQFFGEFAMNELQQQAKLTALSALSQLSASIPNELIGEANLAQVGLASQQFRASINSGAADQITNAQATQMRDILNGATNKVNFAKTDVERADALNEFNAIHALMMERVGFPSGPSSTQGVSIYR